MKVTKKVLSLVLALAMLLTMASFPAFAANIVVSYEYEVGETYTIPIEVIAGEKVTKVYDMTGLITFGTPKAVEGRPNLRVVEAKMNTKGITKIVVEYTDVNEEEQEIVSNYVEIVDPADEPTTVDVTFVDVDGANDDVVKTIDAGATVTIPDAYATGYKFYADEDCTEEIDLATETFDADSTIYVKAQTTTPDPEEPAVVIPGMDRIEITDEVLDTLPITQKVGDKNYVITGWKMNGEDIDYAQLKNLDVADVTGDIVPTVVEVPFDVDLLTAEAKRAGQDGTGAFDNGSKYENGLYLQGAQIRFPDTQAGITAGLRFVTVLDKNLENKLLELNEQGIISGLDHGMVCIAGVDYTNKDLNINTAKSANWGDNIYQSSGLFDGEYYKYTLCVTGFKEAHYEINVCVRPVIKFNYNGETIYLYGEQYNTNYKAVVQEAYNQHLAGNAVLTDLELEYCKEILGLSADNDIDIGDIIK